MDEQSDAAFTRHDEILMEVNAVMGHAFELPDEVEFVWEEGSDVEREV